METSRVVVVALIVQFVLGGTLGSAATDSSALDWVNALHAAAAEVGQLTGRERDMAAQKAWRQVEQRFPLAGDWMLQDAPDVPLWAHVPAGGGGRREYELMGGKLAAFLAEVGPGLWIRMIERVLPELGAEGGPLAQELADLRSKAEEAALAELYLRACEARRAKRLEPLLRRGLNRIVFARHYNMGGSHYAYTEGLSDAQAERHFRPGSSLCLLKIEGTRTSVEKLLDSPEGVIRDVDVSWDGSTILFSWKKSDRQDDYSLYTMDAATRTITTITNDLGHADYEGVFLPNGDILFNSTRCVQIVDCWWTEVSNLYTCGPLGQYLRRLSFDQVHTNYPTLTQDGRVLYTRWDYNDRGQLFPQGLFQMFPDGTAQMEYYGNTSWFPTTIAHARDIPGSPKVLAVFTGHHSYQAGKLGLLDPRAGRQEARGAQLIAPIRETPAERIDAYGQTGDLFMYPWPIDKRHFLVSYAPRGWEEGGNRQRTVFGLYFMDMDGRRELLDIDTEQQVSAGRMVPLAARPQPHIRPSTVDYAKDTGVYYLQDVYAGPGLEGIPRGTIRDLRVIALEFRPAGIGSNNNRGPAGSALISTPISIHGTWDVKTVLGRAKVHEDGSAMFAVPARTPVYFQALDEKGHAVQTMRSWSTLQPGELLSCVGCHSEDKHIAPVLHKPTRAMQAGAQPLDPFYGEPEGFSFQRMVQPILDRSCVPCHSDRYDPLLNVPKIAASASHVYNSLSALSDERVPAHSNDHDIPRFTWWPRRGTTEWVQYDFPKLSRVYEVQVYWFDDSPGGGCRVPQSWQLFYRQDNEWHEVENPSAYGITRDVYNRVTFDPVHTDALRLVVQLQDEASGGLLSWNVLPRPGVESADDGDELRAFSLMDAPNLDAGAKRYWSDAYLALIAPTTGPRGPSNGPVRWVNPQSVPSMLPPYNSGAARSPLITLLEEGHHGVTLSTRDLQMIALWIDLGVPFAGDYTEAHAWSEAEVRKYEHFLEKRRRMEAVERENIEALITSRSGS